MTGCGDKGWDAGSDTWHPMPLFHTNITAAYTRLPFLPPHCCSHCLLLGIHSSSNKYLNTSYVPGSRVQRHTRSSPSPATRQKTSPSSPHLSFLKSVPPVMRYPIFQDALLETGLFLVSPFSSILAANSPLKPSNAPSLHHIPPSPTQVSLNHRCCPGHRASHPNGVGKSESLQTH